MNLAFVVVLFMEKCFVDECFQPTQRTPVMIGSRPYLLSSSEIGFHFSNVQIIVSRTGDEAAVGVAAVAVAVVAVAAVKRLLDRICPNLT